MNTNKKPKIFDEKKKSLRELTYFSSTPVRCAFVSKKQTEKKKIIRKQHIVSDFLHQYNNKINPKPKTYYLT